MPPSPEDARLSAVPPEVIAKLRCRSQREDAFTRIELLIVGVAVLVLVATTVTWIAKNGFKTRRVQCAQNLKIVGLGHKTWAKYSEDAFPFNYSTNREGTKELIGMGVTYRHFFALSNELAGNLKVLVCPSDSKRHAATAWSQLANTNISYFVGVDAAEVLPNSLLVGDRNIMARYPATGSMLVLSATNLVWWGTDLHVGVGNVCLGDGSVQQVDSTGLWHFVQNTVKSWPTNRLEFP